MSVKLTIDGKQVEAQEGTVILEAAKNNGIHIPTLCVHEALEAWGGCRLCIVEITKPQWNNWSKLVTSCLYPVEPDLIVYTKSEKVVTVRRTIIDLLLARTPQSPEIQAVARELGVYKTSYKADEGRDNCIMCGLCVRICEHLGVHAISTVNRGYTKEVATPFNEPSKVCIGCLSCAHICPTQNIPFEETNETRTIWNREFKLVKCEICGRAHISEEQLEYEIQKSGLDRSYFATCEVCKRKQIAETFRELASWQKGLEV